MIAASPLANSVQRGGATESPPTDTLRSYTKAKLAIASQLRALLEVLRKRGGDSRVHRCEELMVKLAEDRFTLAVLGQFKRGKSSLMNAIIGRDLLPTGVLPLTSAITVLKFGPSERLVVRRKRMQFADILPVSELAAFVTENGNPGNFKRVETATLEVPLPFLRRGLEFVDTPGVGSSIEANTQTTYSFLPECDAALFVTSVDTPLTNTELEFLRTIRQYTKKIFFVVNKVDLLQSEAERAEVTAFVSRTICREMQVSEVRVFPVSSRDGLAALGRHDDKGYLRSGVGVLQNVLSEFLSGEKATVFLTSIIDRGIRVLDEESGELDLYEKARVLLVPEKQEIVRRLESRFEQRREVRKRFYAALEELTAQRLNELAGTTMDGVLLSQYRANSRLLDRVPTHATRLPTKWLVQRLTRGVLRRAQYQVRRWVNDQVAERPFDEEGALEAQWRKIDANLRGLPAIAEALLDLPVSKPSEDEPRRFEMELTPERPFLLKDRWSLPVPRWAAWIPAFLSRSLLKTAWGNGEQSFLEELNCQVKQFLAGIAAYAVGRLADQIESSASEVQGRVIAAIMGERPPRPAAQQAFAPLEGLGWGGTALNAIRTNLTTVRDSLDQVQSSELPALDEVPVPAEIAQRRAPRTIEENIPKDLKTRGCPVCNQLVDAAYNFFIEWQYVLGSDEKSQTEFSEELGFCPLHTWQLTAVSSPLGGSVGFARFTQHLSRSIEKAVGSEKAASAVRHLFCSPQRCRVCALLRDVELNYLKRLGEFLREPSNRTRYEESKGVCLRHLGLLLSEINDATTKDIVLKSTARRFEETAEDMQNYAIKREATRRALLNTDETDAWWRAITHISGAQPVCCPWPLDGEI